MGLYRIKKGSHSVGSGDKAQTFRAMGTTGFKAGDDVVESELNLAEWDPGKFEEYKGEVPDRVRQMRTIFKEPRAPLPPDEAAQEEAEDMRAMTADEARARAERFRKRAEALEAKAQESESSSQRYEEEWQPQPAPTPTPDPTKAVWSQHDLDLMTAEELREVAREQKIDLPPHAKKADMVKAIRAAK